MLNQETNPYPTIHNFWTLTLPERWWLWQLGWVLGLCVLCWIIYGSTMRIIWDDAKLMWWWWLEPCVYHGGRSGGHGEASSSVFSQRAPGTFQTPPKHLFIIAQSWQSYPGCFWFLTSLFLIFRQIMFWEGTTRNATLALSLFVKFKQKLFRSKMLCSVLLILSRL